MAYVYLNIHGNGTAICTNEEPTIDDPEFTIIATPSSHEDEFLRMQAWTHDDKPIATPDGDVITMTWRPIYGNVYVDVYFTGSPTPPPEPPTPFNFNWFYAMLAKAANNWRM